jgi:NAD(P)H-hydrate epimerase
MGIAVQADATITFVGLKSGLFLGDGPQQAGDLHFAGLNIPSGCRAVVAVDLRRITRAAVRRALPARPRAAHKGTFGHVVVVGGGPGMPGAVRLAGEAALRAGAGRVSIATHPSHVASIAAGRPELMCHGIESPSDLERLTADASVIALGPGLGQSDWAVALFEALIEHALPLVLDADALNLLAARAQKRANWILTPHPGEAARLLGIDSATIQADRRGSLQQLESRYGGNIVLKGAGTLVSAGNAPAWLCTEGNPGMAAPGMGDVLTGIVAALWAQGLGQEEAAAIGVEIHARAGDAAAATGERGLLAGDLMQALRAWVNP